MQPFNQATKILVIEDSAIGRSIISGIFSDAGYQSVYFANDGIEGIEQTVKLNPDLVVLDLIMPRMDGYDYLKKIRSISPYDTTPVIVQTALADTEKHTQAFAAGATDLILKPISPAELIARATVHLENRILQRNLLQHQERTESELSQAISMQMSILPSKESIAKLEDFFNLKIASHFVASEELSGDLWGIKKISEHEIALYQVDFAGHGVMAAMNTFRLHTLIESKLPLHNRPGDYLTELNNYLHEILMTREFATMFYGVINLLESRLDYAVAASTNAIILESGGNLRVLSGNGLPLSVKENTIYKTQSTPFQLLDTLITYSDALIEKQRVGNQAFDESGLLATCQRFNKTMSPQTMLTAILSAFYETTGDDCVEDDLTIAILQRI
ncbi:MAG: SpoIIE family protein phosphatase [Rickettsiales bacterium]